MTLLHSEIIELTWVMIFSIVLCFLFKNNFGQPRILFTTCPIIWLPVFSARSDYCLAMLQRCQISAINMGSIMYNYRYRNVER